MSTSFTGSRTARQLGWTQSKVSKVETGKQMPTDEDLDGWIDPCQASDVASATLKDASRRAQGLHQEWKQASLTRPVRISYLCVINR
ncbi:helix-turn-helix domain-containing protein [Micromonospora sp. ZYX-F-536]|uniref:helix-turn-helix domain-containing protein n=1 Tax=Micromonospora sp. ZYX-F-536 TaxID=3457629 RepID=UPI0040409556